MYKKMSSVLSVLVIAHLSAGMLLAQELTAKNALYVELGGKAFIYSVNYDRVFWHKNQIKLSSRIGAGYIPEGQVYSSALFVPIALNIMYGKCNKHIELSIGKTFGIYPNYTNGDTQFSAPSNTQSTFLGLGYRYQKKTKGLFFTTSALTYFPQLNTIDFNPWLGLGVGTSF